MTEPTRDMELDRLGRMILFTSTLSLPSGAQFTYRHDESLTIPDIDFIIAYFNLRKQYIKV